MLGMVFSEFVDLVEGRFGLVVLDRAIAAAGIGHDAVYTAVGYYPFTELRDLLLAVSRETDQPPARLLRAFGVHLFGRLREGHPQFFVDRALDLFTLLERVDAVVHVEVRKLYPNARLPSFRCDRESANRLRLRYVSDRGLADLAHGLIDGAAAHFGETIRVQRQDSDADGIQCTDFVIDRVLQ